MKNDCKPTPQTKAPPFVDSQRTFCSYITGGYMYAPTTWLFVTWHMSIVAWRVAHVDHCMVHVDRRMVRIDRHVAHVDRYVALVDHRVAAPVNRHVQSIDRPVESIDLCVHITCRIRRPLGPPYARKEVYLNSRILI